MDLYYHLKAFNVENDNVIRKVINLSIGDTCFTLDLDGIIQAEEASQVKAKIQHSPLNLILLEWRENVTPHRPSSLLPKLQPHLLLRDFSYN